jgi:hypothetical protein
MRRETVCLILLAASAFAQTPETQSGAPRFEVAAIRPSNSKELGGPSGIETRHGLVMANNVTLKRTIAGAYRIGEYRVLGGACGALQPEATS